MYKWYAWKKRVWMSNGRHQVGTDIKLVQEVDPTLIGGFKVEYDYTDPANMFNPSKAEDLTLKTLLKKKALNKGVVITNELDGFWGSHFQGRASSSSGSVCPLRTASGPVGHMFFLERCVASMFLEPRTVRLNAMARPSAPPGKKRAELMRLLWLLRLEAYMQDKIRENSFFWNWHHSTNQHFNSGSKGRPAWPDRANSP